MAASVSDARRAKRYRRGVRKREREQERAREATGPRRQGRQRSKWREICLPVVGGGGWQKRTSGRNGLHRSIKVARVADHVRRGEVAHDEGMLPRAHASGNLLSHPLGIHLRQEVVRGHLRRGDHHALLPGVSLLQTAIEEECDMRILLGLCVGGKGKGPT